MWRRAEAIAEAWAHGLVSSEMEEWEDPPEDDDADGDEAMGVDSQEGHDGDEAMEGEEVVVSTLVGAGISIAQLLHQDAANLEDYSDEEYVPSMPPDVSGELYDPFAPMVEEGFEGEI